MALMCALLVGAGGPSAQGFGYSTATPFQAKARATVVARLYGTNLSAPPSVRVDGWTNRDSTGFRAGSSVLYEFEEMRSRFVYQEFSTSDVVGVCTDYNSSASSCTGSWQTVPASAVSKSITFPPMSPGGNVEARKIAFKVDYKRYYYTGALKGTGSGIVVRSYFLTPPSDFYFRDSSGNEIEIWKQRKTPLSTKLSRPLVIAEGIDIGDAAETDQYFGQLGPLANVLRDGGLDVAMVSFGNPLSSIRVHQVGFQNALKLVHSMKNDPSIRSATMGLSRGGVVARYALAKMEEQGVEHNVSLFISYDSPQRGANISSLFQDLVFNGSNPSPDTQVLINQLKSQAVRELLIDHLDNKDGTSSDYHLIFYSELKALNSLRGYPVNLRKVAWSNGSWVAPTFNGSTFVRVEAEASGRDVNVILTHLDRQAGSYLPATFKNIVDGKTGNATDGDIVLGALSIAATIIVSPLTLFTQTFGGNFRLTVYNDPTFIPTSSALDQDVSGVLSNRFDKIVPSSVRRSHDAVPPEAVNFLLNELGLLGTPPPPAPPAMSPPVNFRITNSTSNNASPAFAWGAPVGAAPTSYRVYRRCTQSNTAECVTPTAWRLMATVTARTFTDASIKIQTSGAPYAFQFHARAVFSTAESIPSNAVTVNGATNPGQSPSAVGADDVPGVVAAAVADGSSLVGDPLPEAFAVLGTRPNPARGEARLRVDLPEPGRVRVTVYDVAGRLVLQPTEEDRPAGHHLIGLGVQSLPSGTYVYRVEVGASRVSGTFTVVR